MDWIWVMLFFACVGLLVPALTLFLHRVSVRYGLTTPRPNISLLLYIYALEVPCIFGVEVGIFGVLRAQHRIPVQLPPNTASWVMAVNVAYICSGVLAVIIGALTEHRHQSGQRGSAGLNAKELDDGS